MVVQTSTACPAGKALTLISTQQAHCMRAQLMFLAANAHGMSAKLGLNCVLL
jgi:hypothetical protein